MVSYSPTLQDSRVRIERSVFQVLLAYLLVHSVVLLAVSFLPFIDLPNHLAEATIFKYYDSAEFPISKYYQPIPWYYPNTFHAVFSSLFPSVEIGNKIFHILCILLLQGGLFLVIRKLNGNQWYGLLGLIFTYNYNVIFGFVGFAISIPTLLFLIYFILLDFEQEKIKWKVLIGTMLVLLFSMHAQNALLGLLIYGVMLLVRYWPNLGKAVLTGTLVALPLVALIFSWWLLKEDSEKTGTAEFLIEYYSSTFWTSFLHRANLITWDNYSLFVGDTGRIVALLFALTLILPAIYFKAWRINWKELIYSRNFQYPAILLVVTGGCYFLLPDKIPGQSPLYERFSTMVMLSAVILLSVCLRGYESRFLKIFCISVLVVYSVLWIEYIVTFNRNNEGFNASFFPDGNKEARIAGMMWENEYRGRKVYIHFQNYFLVWKKGMASSKIIDYRFGIVRRVAPESVLPFYNEYVREKYTRQYHYHGLDYLLARESSEPLTMKHFPTFEKVREQAGFTLYRNSKADPPKDGISSTWNGILTKKPGFRCGAY